MEKLICPVCGKEFIPSRRDQKYCCIKCRKENAKRNLKEIKENPTAETMKKRTCPICGKEFYVFKYAHTLYCSKECAQQARNLKRKVSKDTYEYYARFADAPEPSEKVHLCWSCRNAVPNPTKGTGCSWSINYVPVEGWDAVRHDGRKMYGEEVIFIEKYTVRNCPLYKAG